MPLFDQNFQRLLRWLLDRRLWLPPACAPIGLLLGIHLSPHHNMRLTHWFNLYNHRCIPCQIELWKFRCGIAVPRNFLSVVRRFQDVSSWDLSGLEESDHRCDREEKVWHETCKWCSLFAEVINERVLPSEPKTLDLRSILAALVLYAGVITKAQFIPSQTIFNNERPVQGGHTRVQYIRCRASMTWIYRSSCKLIWYCCAEWKGSSIICSRILMLGA